MAFENLIGNEQIKSILTDIMNKNILHSYLFVGPDGVGKQLFAKEFAKGILCGNEKKPCNNCKSCIEFNSLNHPDFNILYPDKDSIKIDQIRIMTSKIIEKPIISNKKVYIINEADKMTKEASNSLLKTLEEPPPFAVIILVCSNENMLLNTIKSRCTKIIFNKINNELLKQYLNSNIKIDIEEDTMLKLFDGSIGKALTLKDQIGTYNMINNIFSNIENIDIIELLKQSEKIYKEKENIWLILDYINVILLNLSNSKKQYKYLNCIEIVEKVRKNIKHNGNFDINIDNLLLNIWEEINEKHSRC